MKKYNKKTLAAGMLLGAAIAVSGAAFAASDTYGDMRNEMRFSQSHHKGGHNEAAKAAVESGDYAAFKDSVKGKRSGKITKERFEKMRVLHQAKESGDTGLVQKLQKEMREWRQEHKTEMKGHRIEIEKSLEKGDYKNFLKLTNDRKKDVSKEVFEKMRVLHQAKESGDYKKAGEVKMELEGFGFGGKWHGEGHSK